MAAEQLGDGDGCTIIFYPNRYINCTTQSGCDIEVVPCCTNCIRYVQLPAPAAEIIWHSQTDT
jgi:hypothetical protein